MFTHLEWNYDKWASPIILIPRFIPELNVSMSAYTGHMQRLASINGGKTDAGHILLWNNMPGVVVPYEKNDPQ